MANEGISAALKLDDKILTQLSQAENSIKAMAQAAEKLEAGFKNFGTEVKNLANGIKGTGVAFETMFDKNGTLKSIKLISEAVEATGRKATAAARQAAQETKRQAKKAAEAIKRQEKKDELEGRAGDLLSGGTSGIEAKKAKLKELQRLQNELQRNSRKGVVIDPSVAERVSASIDKYKTKLAALNERLKGTSRNAQMVQTLLAQAFSPFILQRFLQQMISVRGEFELAQKSLAVIIRDENRAAEMFNEITQIAVRSPFSVSSILKQTKQLAAYRIEQDKLIDTTKMLGDIAAGVGVDMNRLILAYGQVKAAEFLKGTELRQFSEAGVNMLGGLADRFSEIYNRAVSTGEVLQMVSKRMVKFEDVEAVLRQQTSAGGTFYRMQEQQADTLRGKITNLEDRIRIMFNQIGQSYDGLMKKVITGLENLISNWKAISNLVMPLLGTKLLSGMVGLVGRSAIFKSISAYVASATQKMIALNGSVNLVNRSAIVLRGTMRGIGAAISANWVGILVTVALAIAQAWMNANKLRKELKQIQDDLSKEITNQVTRYNELLDIATDVTKKEQDRSRALDALKAEYGNILDIQNVELANVEQLNKARSEQIELIKIQAFEEAKQKAVKAAVADVQDQRAKQLKELGGSGIWGGFVEQYKDVVPGLIDASEKEMEALMDDLNKKIIAGEVEGGQQMRDEFLKGLLKRSGADDRQIEEISKEWWEHYLVDAFESVFKRVSKSAENLKGFGEDTGVDLGLSRTAQKYKEHINQMAQIREDFEKELTEEDKIFYRQNPAQKKLNLQFLIERYADNMREAVKNQDFGAIGEEMQKKLLDEIEKTFNQNALGNNVELWVLEAAAQVNKEFPNLQTPFGDSGNMGLAKGESLEKLIKRIDDRVKELDADLYKVKYGKGGDVLDVTNRWGEQAMVRIMEEQEALGRFREMIATSQAMTAKEIEQRRKDIESLAADVIALADGWWNLSEAERQFNQENIGERAFDLKIEPPTDYNIESIAKWVEDQVEKIVGPKAKTSLKIKIDKETIKETKDASKTLSGIFDDLVDYYKKTVSEKLPKEVGDSLLEVVQDRVAEFNKNPNKSVEVQLPLAFNLDSLYDWLEENKGSFTNEDFSSALLKLYETKKSDQDSNKNKASQYKSDLKAFLTDLKNARKEMDKLNDAEDKLFVEKLQHQGKKVGIKIADDFKPTKEVLDDIINTYLPKLDKADQIDLRLTWSKEDTSDTIKNMTDEVARLWDQYDNSKKMEDWGFVPQEGSSKETMERIMSYERDLRAQNTEEATKAADDIKKRRLEIARSEQEEAAKIMYEANKKALDKVQQAYQTMQEKIAGIQKSTQPESDKEKAIANQVAKSLRDAADAQWDAYKGSEMYVQSFGDLENMSKSALLGIKAGLIEWSDYAKGALQPTELKAIEKQIKKIDELLGVERTKTHFGAIVKAFQEVTKAGEEMQKLPELSREMADAQFEYIEAQESRAIYESINAQEKSEESARDLADAIEREATAKKNAEDATAAYTAAQNTASTKLNNAKKRVAQVKENFSAFSGAIENTVDFFSDLYEAMGFVVSDETAAAIDGMKQGFALIGSAITMAESAMNAYTIATEIADAAGKSLISTFWPLLAVMVAIGAAVAILKARDAALEKQVEQHKENVEKLEKAYEKLEKAIDKALDLTDARQSYAEMNANLAKQRKELEEAIAANNSRKQTDKVKEETENLQDSLDALDDKVEETRDKWLDMLGAPTDYQGLARDWSEGWLSAFKETGSGLESLHESFDELYDDLVVGQLWSKIMGPQIENLQQMVKDALADGDLTSTEAAAIRAFKNTLAYTSAELEQKAKELGIAGGTLTGDTLQRGVESMTEKTAEALESILNATRYDVSNTNVQVANIANVLSGEGENTILAQLRSQTRYLADIARIASAIYYPGGHPKGAGAIKVITEMA